MSDSIQATGELLLEAVLRSDPDAVIDYLAEVVGSTPKSQQMDMGQLLAAALQYRRDSKPTTPPADSAALEAVRAELRRVKRQYRKMDRALRYAWEARGTKGTSKHGEPITHWYETDSGEHRYQVSEPGTGRRKKQAPQQGGQQQQPQQAPQGEQGQQAQQQPQQPQQGQEQPQKGMAWLTQERKEKHGGAVNTLKGLNREDITPEQVDQITQSLLGMSRVDLHQVRVQLGLDRKGLVAGSKNKLVDALLNHVRKGTTAKPEPVKEPKSATLTSDDVLERIKKSPQFADRDVDWNKYADRWHVRGDFEQSEVDVDTLKKLVNSQHLSMVQNAKINDEDVNSKIKSGVRNPVIITERPGGQMLIVDGNHSFVAAARAGDQKIPVIFPQKRMRDFGVAKPVEKPAAKPEQEAPKPGQIQGKEPWEMTKEEYLSGGVKGYKGIYKTNWRDNQPIIDIDATRLGRKLAGYFSDSPQVAERFASAMRSVNDADVVSASLAMDRPLVVDAKGAYAKDFMTDSQIDEHNNQDILSQLTSGKYDGLVIKNTADEGTIYAPLTGKQIKNDRQHRASVESALAAGKPVPPEVLKDYPDLAAKHSPKEETPATPPEPEKPEFRATRRNMTPLDKLGVRGAMQDMANQGKKLPTGKLGFKEDQGRQSKFEGKSEQEMRDSLQMYEDNAQMLRSQGKKVPDEWLQGMEELRARLSGDNPAESLHSEIGYGHPQHPGNRPGHESLVPIKVDANTDLSWRHREVQKQREDIQKRMGVAEWKAKAGTPQEKKKAKEYLSSQQHSEDKQTISDLDEAAASLSMLERRQKQRFGDRKASPEKPPQPLSAAAPVADKVSGETQAPEETQAPGEQAMAAKPQSPSPSPAGKPGGSSFANTFAERNKMIEDVYKDIERVGDNNLDGADQYEAIADKFQQLADDHAGKIGNRHHADISETRSSEFEREAQKYRQYAERAREIKQRKSEEASVPTLPSSSVSHSEAEVDKLKTNLRNEDRKKGTRAIFKGPATEEFVDSVAREQLKFTGKDPKGRQWVNGVRQSPSLSPAGKPGGAAGEAPATGGEGTPAKPKTISAPAKQNLGRMDPRDVPRKAIKNKTPKAAPPDDPEAAKIADDLHAQHKERTKNATDPEEVARSYEQYKQELKQAGIVPATSTYAFAQEKKPTPAVKAPPPSVPELVSAYQQAGTPQVTHEHIAELVKRLPQMSRSDLNAAATQMGIANPEKQGRAAVENYVATFLKSRKGSKTRAGLLDRPAPKEAAKPSPQPATTAGKKEPWEMDFGEFKKSPEWKRVKEALERAKDLRGNQKFKTDKEMYVEYLRQAHGRGGKSVPLSLRQKYLPGSLSADDRASIHADKPVLSDLPNPARATIDEYMQHLPGPDYRSHYGSWKKIVSDPEIMKLATEYTRLLDEGVLSGGPVGSDKYNALDATISDARDRLASVLERKGLHGGSHWPVAEVAARQKMGHRSMVESKVNNGEQLPDRVLADYPELAEKQNWYLDNVNGRFWDHGARKRSVESALSSGKPVPAEVLEDYPDLAAKYGSKPTPTPAPTSPAAEEAPQPATTAGKKEPWEPGSVIDVAGAKFSVSKTDGDGTVWVRNENGDEFDLTAQEVGAAKLISAPVSEKPKEPDAHLSRKESFVTAQTGKNLATAKDELGRIRAGIPDALKKAGVGRLPVGVSPEQYLAVHVGERARPNKELAALQRSLERAKSAVSRAEKDHANTRPDIGTARYTAESVHRKMVESALSSGKPVPPEVLKDYPDLAAKYGGKPATAPAPAPATPDISTAPPDVQDAFYKAKRANRDATKVVQRQGKNGPEFVVVRPGSGFLGSSTDRVLSNPHPSAEAAEKEREQMIEREAAKDPIYRGWVERRQEMERRQGE